MASFVKPDSVLARTAREVMAAHAGGAGPQEGMTTCPICGEPLPCTSGRRAAEVLFAAGLAELSGLIDAARGGLGPAPSLDLPGRLANAGTEPATPPGSGDAPDSSEPQPDASARAPESGGSGSGPAGPESGAPGQLVGSVQVPADDDPLLLGPPLFTQQNRPLDSPRFTPSAHPGVRPEASADTEQATKTAAEAERAVRTGAEAEPAAKTAADAGPEPSGDGQHEPARTGATAPVPSRPDAASRSASAQPGASTQPGKSAQPGETTQPGKPITGGPEQPAGDPPSGLPGAGARRPAPVPQEPGQASGPAGVKPGPGDDTQAPSPFLRRPGRTGSPGGSGQARGGRPGQSATPQGDDDSSPEHPEKPASS